MLPLYTIILLDFGTVPRLCGIFFFIFILIKIKKKAKKKKKDTANVID
jgi:hypothetical protein